MSCDHLAAQVALDLEVLLDQPADPVDLFVGEVADPGAGIHPAACRRHGRRTARSRRCSGARPPPAFSRGMSTPAMRATLDLQPCRCLWRGFSQITRTTPWRRITLHLSHIALDAGTDLHLVPSAGRRRGGLVPHRPWSGHLTGPTGTGDGQWSDRPRHRRTPGRDHRQASGLGQRFLDSGLAHPRTKPARAAMVRRAQARRDRVSAGACRWRS